MIVQASRAGVRAKPAAAAGVHRREQHRVLGHEPGQRLRWSSKRSDSAPPGPAVVRGWTPTRWYESAVARGSGVQVVVQQAAAAAPALGRAPRRRPARRRTRAAGRGRRNRPGACSAIRCAPASSASSRRAAGGQAGQAGRRAARRPARGAGRAAGTAGPRRAQAAGTTRRTPPGRRWPGPRRRTRPGRRGPPAARRRARPARAAGGSPARAATMARASGSRAQRPMISSTAAGSAATRSAPIRRPSSRGASAGSSRSTTSGWAPCGDQPGEPVAAGDHDQAAAARRAAAGAPARRRGRCPAPPASAGRPAGCGTGAAWSSRWPGSARRGTPSASRKPRSASPGVDRRAGRVEAAQVDVELAVGEAVARPGAPSARPGGLADPGGPGDDDDARGGGRSAVEHVEPGHLARRGR